MISSLTPVQRETLIKAFSGHDVLQNLHAWPIWCRPDQAEPGPDTDWLIWLMLGGRGAGKTRAGAEWIRHRVSCGSRRIALVAPTYSDAREVMIEGESGLLSIGFPRERPKFIASRRRLEWPNGAIGYVFSGEDPDGLRGPQFDTAWADEFCAWEYPDDTLSNLRLGLRLGDKPQLVMTSTPRPLAGLKALMTMPGVVVTRSRTASNAGFLSPAFLSAMEDTYGGTRLGRQELEGEFLEDQPGALWSRDMIEAAFCDTYPDLDKVIVAVDPPITSTQKSDSCGIIVAGCAGKGRDTRAYILYDGTIQGARPEVWARRAIGLWESWDASYILAEVNQGGDMVSSVITMSEPTCVVRCVYARRGKAARAEPVAALYEQGRVHHIGHFSELEDELCLMGVTGVKKSPDRADALVWAVTELLLRTSSTPRVRAL